MTAPTSAPGAHLDLAGVPGIPFWRLFAVELRKVLDTRANRWLLIVMLGLSAAILTVLATTAPEEMRSFAAFSKVGFQPLTLLLPVLGILAMTSEWSHRSALATFALEPRRIRVFLAKSIATLMVSLVVASVGMLMSVLATAASSAMVPLPPNAWTLEAKPILMSVALLEIYTLIGLALGLLLSSNALAITIYYIAPMITLSLSMWEKARPVMEWVSQSVLTQPFEKAHFTAEQAQRSAVAALVWIVIPFLVGAWLSYRREVK
ncbi:hypothetical protein SAMN05421595_1530 [Austwickia chelonae]|uniref:ABC transporter permease protein n=1 Tax=Austwickia chelonae NBRC 105200 TaxID=1184607 RepID=K6W789_9MICO|nr:ABC transporter permease [Austwickia chelonae]GAB77692.1 hypothetical protein AUCHE_05_06070 [Austwickia chelonae NBRC 105200]SEW15893.1 hypothetical protein SAMN05421595_1530 [Austwickia chelonae]